MITYIYGDIFHSPAKALVNPVNTVGVMGKGLAYDFKRIYPEMFARYRELCEQDRLDIGKLMLYKTTHKWIINFPTKKHYRANSTTDYIERGLKKFVESYADMGVTSASFPMLGTGNGKLDWDTEVRPLMEAYLNPLPVTVYIHCYTPDMDDPFISDRRNIRSIRSWLDAQPRYAGFDRFWRALSRMIGQVAEYKRLDTNETFTVLIDKPGRNNRRRNLILRLQDPRPVFIAQSVLVDLWHYVQGAGYVLPTNLPGGLDEYAPYIVSLLAELDMLYPIHMASVGGDKVIGLHYIPSVEKSETPRIAMVEEG